MSSFAVEPADLQSLDGYLATAAGEARAAVHRIRGEAEALFASGWHGVAASAFRLGWEQWLDGVGQVLEALDEMAALLGSSAAGYAGTEDAVRVSLARGPA